MPGMTGIWPDALTNVSESDVSALRVVAARARQFFTTATAWASANSATASPFYVATGYNYFQGAWSGSSALSASGVKVGQYYSGLTGTGGNDSGTAVYESLFGGTVTGAFSVELVADYARVTLTNGAAVQSRFQAGGHLKAI